MLLYVVISSKTPWSDIRHLHLFTRKPEVEKIVFYSSSIPYGCSSSRNILKSTESLQRKGLTKEAHQALETLENLIPKAERRTYGKTWSKKRGRWSMHWNESAFLEWRVFEGMAGRERAGEVGRGWTQQGDFAVYSVSHVRLFATPWTAAHQASLSF